MVLNLIAFDVELTPLHRGGFEQSIGPQVRGAPSRYTNATVELLSEKGTFVNLPSLSCGGIHSAAAIAVEESDSPLGKVLLLGVKTPSTNAPISSVQLVDLATGGAAREVDSC